MSVFAILGKRGIEPGTIAREASAGMGGGVDHGELRHRYAGVDPSGFQAFVAEENLDEPKVGTVFKHQRRGGVAQQTASAQLPDAVQA